MIRFFRSSYTTCVVFLCSVLSQGSPVSFADGCLLSYDYFPLLFWCVAGTGYQRPWFLSSTSSLGLNVIFLSQSWTTSGLSYFASGVEAHENYISLTVCMRCRELESLYSGQGILKGTVFRLRVEKQGINPQSNWVLIPKLIAFSHSLHRTVLSSLYGFSSEH